MRTRSVDDDRRDCTFGFSELINLSTNETVAGQPACFPTRQSKITQQGAPWQMRGTPACLRRRSAFSIANHEPSASQFTFLALMVFEQLEALEGRGSSDEFM